MTTADSYSYTTPSMDDGRDDPPIRVEVDEYRQRRWTVALRILLAIPQMLVVGLIGVMAWPVLIIGWFAALCVGRIPNWAHNFLADYLLYSTRLNAYVMFLTDRYPPFSKAPYDPYPVRLFVAERGRLSRVKVLFRLILVLPVMAVMSLVTTGWWVLGLVHWIVVLAKGRYPEAMFEASSAVLRGIVAYSAYLLLLTDSYPWVLYHDPRNPGSYFPRSSGTFKWLTTYLVIGVITTVFQQYSAITHPRFPGPQDQTAGSSAAGPTSPGLPGSQPGADPWQTLMTRIPAGLAPGCSPWEGGTVGSNAGLAAAIHCSVDKGAGQPDSYYYFQYQDQASLDNAFLLMTLTQQYKMAKDTSGCVQGIPSAGSFYYQTGVPQTAPQISGFVACGMTPDGQGFVDSTDNKSLILVDVSGTNMALPQLYDSWNRSDLIQGSQ